MILLTREEIDSLNVKQCQTQLKKLAKEYDLDLDHSLLDPQVQRQVDDIANMILWLEDRIYTLDLSDKLSKASEIRWANVAEKSQT